MSFNNKIKLFVNLVKTLVISILILLLFSFVFALFKTITNNDNFSYITAYLIFITVFTYKNFSYIKECFNNIKQMSLINMIKIFLVSAFIIVFSQIIYNTLINKLHITSNVADINNEMLFNSKLLVSFQFIILAPITEEYIFRLPYHKIDGNKLVKYTFFSLVFALAHINLISLSDYIFLIPYLLLSLGIGYGFYKKDNIILSMIFHILNNAGTIIMLLFF